MEPRFPEEFKANWRKHFGRVHLVYTHNAEGRADALRRSDVPLDLPKCAGSVLRSSSARRRMRLFAIWRPLTVQNSLFRPLRCGSCSNTGHCPEMSRDANG